MHRLDARNRSTNTRHSTEGTYQPHSKHDCATGKNGKPCMYGLRSLSFQARLFRILHQIIFLLLHIPFEDITGNKSFPNGNVHSMYSFHNSILGFRFTPPVMAVWEPSRIYFRHLSFHPLI